MVKKTIPTIFFLLISTSTLSQSSYEIVQAIDFNSYQLDSLRKAFSLTEKIDLYQELYKLEDSVQFEYPLYDPEYEDDPFYFQLDTGNLIFLDLDFDGQLDLIYSGLSSISGVRGTKIFRNKGGSLVHEQTIAGFPLDIQYSKGDLKLFIVWAPCCDSYTSRIETYIPVKNNETAWQMEESISVVGYGRLKGIPDFSSFPQRKISSLELMFSKEDFRRTHPYFRKDNKAFKDSLRSNKLIPLLSMDTESMNVSILAERVHNDQKMWLILTPALDNVPKSHYEWSAGDRRRFIGWIYADENE